MNEVGQTRDADSTSPEAPSAAPPDWYDDGSGQLRWWDGEGWTAHVNETTPPPEPQPPAPQPVILDATRRHQVVSMVVANAVASGWRLEFMGPDSAVLVRGHRPNHVLHLLLTIFSFGLWGVGWIVIALTSQEQRTTVRVDDYGNVIWL